MLNDEEADEMALVEASLERILTARFGGSIQLFEHGNSAAGSHVGCSVEHAHLHFIPGAPDLWPSIAPDLPWTELRNSLPDHVRGREYIRYRRGDGAWFVYAAERDAELPSQFLRRRFAEALGIAQEWNWRESPRLEITARTMERLRDGSDSLAIAPTR